MTVLDDLRIMLEKTEVDDTLQPTLILHCKDIFLGTMSKEAKQIHCLIERLKREVTELKKEVDVSRSKKIRRQEALFPNSSICRRETYIKLLETVLYCLIKSDFELWGGPEIVVLKTGWTVVDVARAQSKLD